MLVSTTSGLTPEVMVVVRMKVDTAATGADGTEVDTGETLVGSAGTT